MAQGGRTYLVFCRRSPARPEEFDLQELACGVFENVGMVFAGMDDRGHVLFHTCSGSEFGKYLLNPTPTQLGRLAITPLPSYNNSRGVEFLALNLTEDETRRMYETCQAFVRLRIPFNLKDYAFRYMLFHTPPEINLFELKKMSDAQAVILFLRECLDKENPIIESIKSLNSRCTCIESLYEAIKGHASECKQHRPAVLAVLGSSVR
jgi:hypothetical protein